MNSNRGDLIARLTTLVDRLPEERVTQLLELGDDALLALLQGSETAKPSPTAPTTEQTGHAQICIPFEINGQKFEAVDFLRQGETTCLSKEALRRADNGHLVRKEADWQLLYRNRSQLPAELHRFSLITARPYPDDPRAVSALSFDINEWDGDWYYLDYQWSQGKLMVRRLVSN